MKNTLLLAMVVAAAPMLSMAQEVKGDAGAGAKKIAMCIGCHGLPGYQASFPQVYKVPKIAGQNAKYIVAALNGYRAGDRKHPSMRGIAGSLSDQDIADVAAYYSELGENAGADSKSALDNAGLAPHVAREVEDRRLPFAQRPHHLKALDCRIGRLQRLEAPHRADQLLQLAVVSLDDM